ncbi:dihydroorotase [Dellaglioa sp. BT-FLS60]
MKKLIKNGTVFLNHDFSQQDVLIEDDKIKAIGVGLADELSNIDLVIDAENLIVTPGLVDLHVHYREPGFEYKETIKTGSQAAARGGFTTVGAMPNLDPVPDTIEHFSEIKRRNQKDGQVHIAQYAAITKNRTSEELVDFVGLKEAGAFAFTNDGSGIQTAGTMYLAMKEAASVNLPLVSHVEDNSLLFGGVMNEGIRAKNLGLPGIMGIVESSQLARDLMLAQKTGVHYHMCHVSTKESVELIRLAKSHGIKVTCEVSPHHLLLTDSDIHMDNGNYKMNPPLRTEDDRLALIKGLLDGTIDMIATDHAPHSEDEKRGSMIDAAFGITGSETAFSLLYTRLVKTGILTLSQLIVLMSENPAKKFNLDSGTLKPGMNADIAIFDLKNKQTIKAADYLSKGKNSPFTGQEVYGATLVTMVSGEIKYDGRKVE